VPVTKPVSEGRKRRRIVTIRFTTDGHYPLAANHLSQWLNGNYEVTYCNDTHESVDVVIDGNVSESDAQLVPDFAHSNPVVTAYMILEY
jgi:hypothetical protein